MSTSTVGAYAVRVYYEDTDSSGRVYHASYVRYLERGRTEWLRGAGFSHREIASNYGIIFAVRRMQIEFLGPAQMDDLLRVETEVSAVRAASIDFRQWIFRGDRELVSATVVIACIRDGRAARIPEHMRRALRE
jgi:acyl-CoA thioester hydrolase